MLGPDDDGNMGQVDRVTEVSEELVDREVSRHGERRRYQERESATRNKSPERLEPRRC